jgi:chorismate synthase
MAKYGLRNWKGGGRASARETIGRVAAAAVAKKVLGQQFGTEIIGYVKQVSTLQAEVDSDTITAAKVESNIVRCPDLDVATRMITAIDEARKKGDTVGGVIEAVARGVPPGLGEPVFDKLDADLGKAILSLPACKGFEVGSGFGGTTMTGSQHNDPYYNERGRIRTRTNYSGGIQGGISIGENIIIRAAFKPVATIMKPQETIDIDGNPTTLEGRGRHDPCVLPRAVPMVEAMMALVLVDHALRQRGQRG